MKPFRLLLAIAFVALGITSCDISNKKIYEGPDQVAFENSAVSVKFLNDTTYTVRVQLITADQTNNRDIPVKIAFSGDAVGPIVVANSIQTTATIKAGEYSANIPLPLLVAGAGTTAKKITFTLSADGIKLAENYKVMTLSITKIVKK